MTRKLFSMGLIVLAALFMVPNAVADSNKTEDDSMMMEDDNMMMEVTYTGYLMDTLCGVKGVGMDGSDVVNSPQDHTLKCLIACKDSGYGISVPKDGKYAYIPFDKAGSDLAYTTIVSKAMKENDFKIKVTGVLDNNVLTVKTIEEVM